MPDVLLHTNPDMKPEDRQDWQSTWNLLQVELFKMFGNDDESWFQTYSSLFASAIKKYPDEFTSIFERFRDGQKKGDVQEPTAAAFALIENVRLSQLN